VNRWRWAGIVAALLLVLLSFVAWPYVASKRSGRSDNAARGMQGPHTFGFAKRLLDDPGFAWFTHETEYGHLHFPEGSYAASHVPELEVLVDSGRSAALAFLELKEENPWIEVFVVDTREQTAALTGRPVGGTVQSGERTALLMYNGAYAPFITHELTHLYTHFNWGPPRNGRWISEGIATLAAGDCQGHGINELATGLLVDRSAKEWTAFARDFDRLEEVSANVQAASMLDFIRSRQGLGGIRELWQNEGWSSLEKDGIGVTQMDSLWRGRLTGQFIPARLDTAKLRQEGCG
jgi:hypothetical protein